MIYMNRTNFLKKLIILICLIFINMFTMCVKCNAETNKVLILYDVSNAYGKDDNILNRLIKMQLNMKNEVDIKKISLNNLIDVDKYDEICILQIKKDCKIDIEDKLKSINKPVYMFDENFEKCLENYFNKKNIKKLKSKYVAYFYLENATPFNDLNLLIAEIDYLNSNGINFFIEVTPVFINEDLNAMGRFAETLRYAQANGGKVVLKEPIINSSGVNGLSISEKIISQKFIDGYYTYIKYWVYPVGISINDSDFYKEDLKSLLEGTNTLFINENVSGILDIDNYNIKSLKNIIQKVNCNQKSSSTINGDGKYALCVDSNLTLEEFKKEVDKIKNNNTTFLQKNMLDSYINFENKKIESNIKGIFLNNKDVTQTRFINEEEYKNTLESINNQNIEDENITKADLTKSNIIIEGISILALIIFVIILVLSKNKERKKFFK